MNGGEVEKVDINEKIDKAASYLKPNSPDRAADRAPDSADLKIIRDFKPKSSIKRRPPQIDRGSQITPDTSPKDMLQIVARAFTTILEISTNHVSSSFS